MRRLLVKVSVVYHLLFFFKPLSFLIIRLATMKDNKEKNVASGTEEEEDVQVQDEPTPLVVQATAGKRKSISSSIDLGNLPRR